LNAAFTGVKLGLYAKGRTKIDIVWERGAKENIWTQESESNRLLGKRKLHNEKFHNLHSSPNVIVVITSWRMIWAVHGTEETCIHGFE